ncbi:MAG: WS/DGAT/MGAT family acyltransferase [Candidatus Azotimanducaceae bacterium]|jgi:diacylglycerol O-acyltransferase
MEQLTGQDASFLYSETPRSPMHIGAIAIYDPSELEGGVQRFKSVLGFIEDRLHLAKTFRRKLVRVPFSLDHPYWIEDRDFDIEFHLRHIRLPEPGDWRQLCIQAARLHARPLDLTKPLWEFTVIEGLDAIPGLPKGCYALVSKIHHACIDGVSGSDIVEAIHSIEPHPPMPEPLEQPWQGEKEPNPLELMTRAQINNMTQPFRFAEVMAKAMPAMGRFNRGLAERKFSVNADIPRTRFSGIVSSHRVVEGRSFELAKIKEIKNLVDGATVNDAVLTIVGGALRKYLLSKKELPVSTLVAMAPISVRSTDGKNALGNQVAAMTVRLGTDTEDSLQRLAQVHDAAMSSKEMTNAVGAKLMTDFSQFIPSTTAAMATRLYTEFAMAENVSQAFNCVVTNVPGPQFPLYMAGARLVTQYGLGPIFDGMGIIFPVFSYGGQITISFNSCRKMVPDPDVFADFIQETYDELLAHTATHTETTTSEEA